MNLTPDIIFSRFSTNEQARNPELRWHSGVNLARNNQNWKEKTKNLTFYELKSKNKFQSSIVFTSHVATFCIFELFTKYLHPKFSSFPINILLQLWHKYLVYFIAFAHCNVFRWNTSFIVMNPKIVIVYERKILRIRANNVVKTLKDVYTARTIHL